MIRVYLQTLLFVGACVLGATHRAEAAVLLPPSKYAAMPTPAYVLHRAPRQVIQAVCKHPPGVDVYGCAFPGRFTIWIDEDLRGQLLEYVLEHEEAHLKGWRH